MKCKNWSNKFNNFVVKKLKSFKINGQSSSTIANTTMPNNDKLSIGMDSQKQQNQDYLCSHSLACNDLTTNIESSACSSSSSINCNSSNIRNCCRQAAMASSSLTTNKLNNSSNDSLISRKNSCCCRLNKIALNEEPLPSSSKSSQQTINYSTTTTATQPRTSNEEQQNLVDNLCNCNLSILKSDNKSSINCNECSSINEKQQQHNNYCCGNSIENSPLANTTKQQSQENQSISSAMGASSSQKKLNTGPPMKKTPNDFIFGKYLGEGSFSTVLLGYDIHSKKEYAIKVCEKMHIIRERKQQYIKRERDVMNMLSGKPGFVDLYCSFQDEQRLYFVMTWARNGDLLPYITKVGSFDIECTRHYCAEIVLALEVMAPMGIVHRDLKPENILLDDNMHILIADFGSTKLINPKETMIKLIASKDEDKKAESKKRKCSFVGTAQYVSPEMLTNGIISHSADLWALGCILFQMIAGLPPFRGPTDFYIFREILSLNIDFPEGFDPHAKDLILKLLRIHPAYRLGAEDELGYYESIRRHPFFEKINWDTLRTKQPPAIYPYIPSSEKLIDFSKYNIENMEPGLDDKKMTQLVGLGIMGEDGFAKKTEPRNSFDLTESEMRARMLEQEMKDMWHMYSEGDLILKKGFINKKKGLFARKRMLILTTGPKLIYIDPYTGMKKGEIPWTTDMRVEPKNFKIFFVHTPNRTYYLEDPQGYALEWVDSIENVHKRTYDIVAKRMALEAEKKEKEKLNKKKDKKKKKEKN